MSAAAPELAGARVLLVEDGFLAGLELKTQLERMGCEVLGPVASVAHGLRALEERSVDIGVLDIDLRGETSAPIAVELIERECPLIFVTGYMDPAMLPGPLRELPRLLKPVEEDVLERALLAELARIAE